MSSRAAFAADLGADGDDDANGLKAYVADMQAHAESICEQLQDEISKERHVLKNTGLLAFLQDEVAKQGAESQFTVGEVPHAHDSAPLTMAPRFAQPNTLAPRLAEPQVLRDAKRFEALVQVAQAEKESNDSYWKDWAGTVERASKARYAKAHEEVSKAMRRAQEAEDRAMAAELRATELEAASLPGASAVLTSDLKLDDFLRVCQSLGVKIALAAPGSKESELDSLVAEVVGDEATSNWKRTPPKGLLDPLLAAQAPQAQTFAQVLQTAQSEMEKSFRKLAQQHELEMSNRSLDTIPVLPELPKLGEDLRNSAAGELPGQVPELNKAKLDEDKLPSKENQVQLCEPRLCAVWGALLALDREPKSDAEGAIVVASDDERGCCRRCFSRCCCCCGRFNRLVMCESSKKRLLWDLLSAVLVAYEVVVTPLHVLGLPNNVVFNGMMFGKPIFWFLDIGWSFISGHVHDGIDEVQLRKIACRYLCTFLPLDAFLLALDVCTLLLLSHGTLEMVDYNGRRLHGTHIDESPQDERVLFAVRCLLALRVLKVHGQLGKRISWRIHSQSLRIKLGVAHIVALIFFSCHVAACGFYAIGVIVDDQDNSWVEKNLVGKTLGYKYILSLQWALAQFSMGTTEVSAGSLAECAYAASVTLIASIMLMLLFGRAVGAALHLASTANGKRQQQLSTLMEYLVQCQVPAPLRSRVWATAAQQAAILPASVCRVHEEEVAILASLPEVLRSELREVTYSPTLTKHPLFRELEYGCALSAPASGRAMRVMHAALSEYAMQPDQVLFTAGKVGKHMYFVAHGELSYTMTLWPPVGLGHFETRKEAVGPWFSEPALWIQWEHCGEMTAVVHTELLALEAKRFQDLTKQDPQCAALCCRYAKAFASYAKQCPQMEGGPGRLTDVHINEDALQGILSRALEGFAEGAVSLPVASESAAVEEARSFSPTAPDISTLAPMRSSEPPKSVAAPEPVASLSVPAAPATDAAGQSYQGTFTHPTFGPDEIPIEVSFSLDGHGQWVAEGQTECITVQREGSKVIMAETTGTTQLDGQEMGDGMLLGAVIQDGVRGGGFQLRPRPPAR